MKQDRINNLPIYQKARELVELVHAFNATIPEDDLFLKSISQLMVENSAICAAKIAGAEGSRLYDLKMQNAAIIRQAGMDLYVQIGALRFQENFSETEYVEMIRAEIEVFREMFKEWIASFNPKHFIPDPWGLFNPPGFNEEDYNENDSLDWDDDDDDDD